jgi:hypothetical protein
MLFNEVFGKPEHSLHSLLSALNQFAHIHFLPPSLQKPVDYNLPQVVRINFRIIEQCWLDIEGC